MTSLCKNLHVFTWINAMNGTLKYANVCKVAITSWTWQEALGQIKHVGHNESERVFLKYANLYNFSTYLKNYKI